MLEKMGEDIRQAKALVAGAIFDPKLIEHQTTEHHA